MKTENIWMWREQKLNSKLLTKSPRSSGKQFSPLNSAPGIIDAYQRQREDSREANPRTAQESRLILHEVCNTMTALLLTLENLTSPPREPAALEETVEILKRLSNRLNCSIEKFGRLFSDSSTTGLKN